MTDWRVLPLAQLEQLAEPWNELIDGTVSPLADRAWLCAWAEAFGVPTSAAVHALVDGDQLLAALALRREGRVVRVWGSLENEHWPYWVFPWPAPDPASASRLLDQLLADADYLFLRRLHLEGPACRALLGAAEQRGLPHSVIRHPQSDAVIELGPRWADLEARLSKNLVRDTPRKRRRLARMGRLELAILDQPGPTLGQALEECFDLEARGWKGESGSPIRSRPETLRFYREVAQRFAAAGRFVLYLLKLDGRLVAFEYCLRGGGHLEMLKLSFDPALSKNSPGNVLRMMLLEKEVAAGRTHTYHLGRVSPWKLRWATRVSPVGTLRIYAHSLRGRATYLLGPALRARAKGFVAARKARHAGPRRALSGQRR